MMIIYYLTLLKHNIAYRLPHLLPSAGPTDNLREYATLLPYLILAQLFIQSLVWCTPYAMFL